MYRIFLVEDDETIAKLVRRHLEKWDYDVHVVQKFDAVMSEFASFDPHLVLYGYRSAVLQWVSLVYGNQKGIKGSCGFPVIRS